MIRNVKLPLRDPLDWSALLGFLGPRAIPGVEEVRGGAYRRIVPDGEGASLIELSRPEGGGAILLRVRHGCGGRCTLGREDLRARARRLLDLDADPLSIRRHLARDPLLRGRARRCAGLRVPGAWDPFQSAVRALLGQQISVRGATTLSGRLVERLGRRVPRASLEAIRAGTEPGDGSAPPLRWLFPPAGRIARNRLEGIGMPGARVEALRGLARAIASGGLNLEPLAPAEATAGRLEEIVSGLRRMKGIGPWTAQYLAMRVLAHPDAFPSGDLGLLKATGLTPAGLERRAERWRPYRAYAALWLWQGD